MNKTLLAVASTLAIAAVPQLALAQTAAPAAPDAAASAPAADAPPASPLSFNIGAITEYRYRGISQTRFKPAVQGGADYAFSSGFYVGTWLSNIKWIHDLESLTPGADTGGSVEWDLYGGYKGEITKDLTYDVGLLEYFYPGNHLGAISGARNANTLEVYGALTYGPATVKYSHSITTLFGTGGSKNSGYLEAAATFDLGNGFGITPHVGYQHVAGHSESGASNSVFSYTDYSLTGAKDFGNGIVVTLAVVGTSTKDVPGSYAYASPANKNLGRTAAVLGVKYTF
jgi:uncharacterized protein (TIGR02001 family)